MGIALIKDKIETFRLEHGIVINELIIEDFIVYKIEKKDLLNLLNFLNHSTELRFTILTDLFAADFLNRDARFELNYSLLSLKLNIRILLKIICKEEETIPSINTIYRAAGWYEREVFDMFGIIFENNHDMRRILTDYGFVGHPLKKDFPLTGFLQVKYDETLNKVIYEPVKLDQEFRNFDFSSPWEGPNYILPGDEKSLNNTSNLLSQVKGKV